ncbi:MAG TPA: PH domain-containing protein [Ktedonobacteraceae bacterium]|nr:PH domain-containing protein [Ktedonobacteraceae bacterium]
MSSKVQEKKTAAASAPEEDRFRSGRSRFGLQQLRVGRDKRWHFAGQQPDETVRMVVRRHKFFLLTPALPLLGSIILLGLVLFGATSLPNPLIPWPFFEILAIALIIGTAAWFVYKDFLKWYLETYIITNKRIINSRGLLEPTRQATPFASVKQVGVDLDNFLGFWLRYGTVHVYLTGGDLVMYEVPNPRKVKDVIDSILLGIQAAKPKEEKPPTPAIPEVAAVIDTLSKAKEPPKLENADENLPIRNPEGRIGPRRTFGGILNIPAEVHYTSGEFTVRYVQRSRYVLLRQLTVPVLALLIALPLTVYVPLAGTLANQIISIWWFGMTVLVLALLATIFFIYTNYVDDVYILTNRRIIDIERRYLMFYEMRSDVDYKNIKDIKVKVPNLVQRLLDIGDVYIEVSGTPGLVLPTVDHPFYIQDKIFEIQKNKEKNAEVQKINDEKKELHKWFSNVVTTLVETTQLKGAPPLLGKSLLEAMEVAGELGFHVIVYDEDASNPDVPPGRVVHQSPPPGTAINPDGEIQVILSA